MTKEQKKYYIKGLKKAAQLLKKEYFAQKQTNPGNLDGYTHGWFYSLLWGKIRKLEEK